MALHDICDEWKIFFLDDNLNALPRTRLLSLKTTLENRIKTLKYPNKGEEIRYPQDFTLKIDQNYMVGEQYSMPDGAPYDRAVKDIQNTCIQLAKAEKLNMMMEVLVTAIECGNSTIIKNQAAVFFGQSSTAKVQVYEDDSCLYYDIYHKNPTDWVEVKDDLLDQLNDNFKVSPWEEDNNGDLTAKGEKMMEKVWAYYYKAF